MNMNINIPDSHHKAYSYNCLTDAQFAELQKLGKTGQLSEEWECDCDECGNFFLDAEDATNRRCSCGNRRCYFQYDEKEKFFYVAVD